LLRWLQWGVFSPILRTHSSKNGLMDRRFWKFPEYFEAMKSAIKLRYELNPYIYTAAHNTYNTGLSLCLPLYYQYPQQPEAYTFTHEYFFGNDMIIAPITTAVDKNTKLATQKIWLPKGEWVEWMTGTTLQGNKVYERKFTESEIPVYVKAGSIIPTYPNTIKNLQQAHDTLVLNVFKNAAGETTIYDDNSKTDEYRNGIYTTRQVLQKSIGNKTTVTIMPIVGQLKSTQQTSFEIRLPLTLPAKKVMVNGIAYQFNNTNQKATYGYNAKDLQTEIFIPASSANKKITIEVVQDSSLDAALLQNKKSFFNRMAYVTAKLKYEISKEGWNPENIANIISDVNETATKIEYDPQHAKQYLEEMQKNIPAMLQAIRATKGVDKNLIETLINYLSF